MRAPRACCVLQPPQHPLPCGRQPGPSLQPARGGCAHSLPRGRLTAGGDVAAGVQGVDLPDGVGAVLPALHALLRGTGLGPAGDAAAALQAEAVLAVELKVLPKLQGGRGARCPESAPAHAKAHALPASRQPSQGLGAGGPPFRARPLTSQLSPAHQPVPAQAWRVWQAHHVCLRGLQGSPQRGAEGPTGVEETQQTTEAAAGVDRASDGRWWRRRGVGGPRYLSLPGLK